MQRALTLTLTSLGRPLYRGTVCVLYAVCADGVRAPFTPCWQHLVRCTFVRLVGSTFVETREMLQEHFQCVLIHEIIDDQNGRQGGRNIRAAQGGATSGKDGKGG